MNKLINISIVTPVLNGESTLQQTIDSVLNQNFQNLEYILVDGMSSDKTHQIIRQNENNLSKVIIGKDKNIYDAMNKGIQAAKGDIVGILNSDDYLNENSLNLVAKKYKQSPNKDIIIYGDMYQEYKETNILSFGDLSRVSFKNGNFKINHPAIFVARSLYNKIGLFNIKFSSGADREFLLRAHKNKIEFLKINKPLATFRLGGFTSSYSSKIILNRTKEEFYLLKKYYPFWHAVRKSYLQFFRMIRNGLLYNILGKEKFLKYRIKWLLDK